MIVPSCFMAFIVALLFVSFNASGKAHARDYQNMSEEDEESLIKALKRDCLDVIWGRTLPGAAISASNETDSSF